MYFAMDGQGPTLHIGALHRIKNCEPVCLLKEELLAVMKLEGKRRTFKAYRKYEFAPAKSLACTSVPTQAK